MRSFWHLIKTPAGCLLVRLVWTCPTGRQPQGRLKASWREYISHLAREHCRTWEGAGGHFCLACCLHNTGPDKQWGNVWIGWMDGWGIKKKRISLGNGSQFSGLAYQPRGIGPQCLINSIFRHKRHIWLNKWGTDKQSTGI